MTDIVTPVRPDLTTYLKVGYLLGQISGHTDTHFTIYGATYPLLEIEYVTGYRTHESYWAGRLGVSIRDGFCNLMGARESIAENYGILEAVCKLYENIEWRMPKSIYKVSEYRGGHKVFHGSLYSAKIVLAGGKWFLSPNENGFPKFEVKGETTQTVCRALCSEYVRKEISNYNQLLKSIYSAKNS